MTSKGVQGSLANFVDVTDYVANGSFASLKENVRYLKEDGFAILVRLVDHNGGWQGERVFVDERAYIFLSKSSLVTGDIVVSNVGAPGTAFRVPPLNKPTTLGPNAVRVRTRQDCSACLDDGFLYYYLISPIGQAQMRSIVTGSAQPKFNKTAFRSLKVSFPPIVQQRAISRLLEKVDRRIALLCETNLTLEAIAQALFKSWFVDFDPVRAKQQGLSPAGMDEATAALFADNFDQSVLGSVPRGWHVQSVGDVVACMGGATPDTKDSSYWQPEEHAWTTPKDLSGLPAPVLLTTERRLSTKGLAKIGSGLLPEGTLLLSSRAPIGYLAITSMPVAINQGYIAMPPGGRLPPLYMLLWCRTNMEGIKARANGSTFMEISKKAFRPIPILIPPAEVVDAFLSAAAPLFDRLIENERQAQTLAVLRDTLLPRLISGNLRLPEAEALAA